MKVKLEDILSARPELDQLNSQQAYPAKTNYKLSKLSAKVDSEIKQWQKTYTATAEKYKAVQKEDGRLKFANAADEKKFNDEIDELIKCEVDLYNFEPISLKEILIPGISLSPKTIGRLELFFVDDFEKEDSK